MIEINCFCKISVFLDFVFCCKHSNEVCQIQSLSPTLHSQTVKCKIIQQTKKQEIKFLFVDNMEFYTKNCKHDFGITIRFEQGSIFHEKLICFNWNRFKNKMLWYKVDDHIKYRFYYFIIDTQNECDNDIFNKLFVKYKHTIHDYNFQDTVVPEKQYIFKHYIERLYRFKKQSSRESKMTSKYLEKVEEFNRLGTFKLFLPDSDNMKRYDFITPYLEEKIELLKQFEQYNKNGYSNDYLSKEICKFVLALNQYTLGVKQKFTIES